MAENSRGRGVPEKIGGIPDAGVAGRASCSGMAVMLRLREAAETKVHPRWEAEAKEEVIQVLKQVNLILKNIQRSRRLGYW